MESHLVFLLACLFAMVALSLQYDDRVLSLKEASLARLAKRDRGKLNIIGEYRTPKGRILRVAVQGDNTSRGSRLRINGEYFGRNGGSIQGSVRRDTTRGLDFFRGANNRGNMDASFDARLPSGAGIGGRARMGRNMNVGLTGISSGMAGQFEGGINDAFGNHFEGGFQGGLRSRVGLPVHVSSYVPSPYERHHTVVFG